MKDNKVILNGYRNFHDGLWDVPIPQPSSLLSTPLEVKHMVSKLFSPQRQKANIIIRKDKTKMELAQWLHASCGSPNESTFIKAIQKGNFLTWPGLTPQLIRKQLPTSEATSKGHLNQERKSIQSTKSTISINPPPQSKLMHTLSHILKNQTSNLINVSQPLSHLKKLLKLTVIKLEIFRIHHQEDTNTY